VRTAALIPCFNNADSIGAAVAALRADPRVDEVLVIDDGSTDATARAAGAAGARVISLGENCGKHVALDRGFLEVHSFDVFLMVDGDTGSTAGSVADLLDPIIAGNADMVVGVLPSAGNKGGFGTVRTFARWCIARTSGFESRAPMSGQRALRRSVYDACRPLSYGYAVDAAMTADAARKGFRILEIDVDMTHDHRGRSLRGFLHRARQGWHILRTFAPRLVRRSRP